MSMLVLMIPALRYLWCLSISPYLATIHTVNEVFPSSGSAAISTDQDSDQQLKMRSLVQELNWQVDGWIEIKAT